MRNSKNNKEAYVRILNLLFLGAISTGCAGAPKETLKEVFTLAKNSKYLEAEQLAEKSAGTLSRYVTYNNETLDVYSAVGTNRDSIDSLLSSLKSSIEYCDKLVTALNSKETSAEEDSFWVNEKKAQSLNDLSQQCGHNSFFEQVVLKIKQYSTVDLTYLIENYKNKTEYEQRRIANETAANELKEQQDTINQKNEKEKYESSPEYYVKKLCEVDNIIKLGKRSIEKENEVGKISGYVDKRKLYQIGKVIQANQDHLNHFGAEYKSRFGKMWSSSNCKNQ